MSPLGSFKGAFSAECCYIICDISNLIQVLNRLERNLAAEWTRSARTLGQLFNGRGVYTQDMQNFRYGTGAEPN